MTTGRIPLHAPPGCRFVATTDGVALQYPLGREADVLAWHDRSRVQLERDLVHQGRLAGIAQARVASLPSGPVTTRGRNGQVTVTPLGPPKPRPPMAPSPASAPPQLASQLSGADPSLDLCADCEHDAGRHSADGAHPCLIKVCSCEAFVEMPIRDTEPPPPPDAVEEEGVTTSPGASVAAVQAIHHFPGVVPPGGSVVVPRGRTQQSDRVGTKEGPPAPRNGVARPGTPLPPGYKWVDGMIARDENYAVVTAKKPPAPPATAPTKPATPQAPAQRGPDPLAGGADSPPNSQTPT